VCRRWHIAAGRAKKSRPQQLADLGVQFLDLGFTASLGRVIATVNP